MIIKERYDKISRKDMIIKARYDEISTRSLRGVSSVFSTGVFYRFKVTSVSIF